MFRGCIPRRCNGRQHNQVTSNELKNIYAETMCMCIRHQIIQIQTCCYNIEEQTALLASSSDEGGRSNYFSSAQKYVAHHTIVNVNAMIGGPL